MLEKFIGDVKGIFNTITITEMILSIIYLLVGIIFFSNPNFSNLVVSILTGIILVLNGVTAIVSYIKRGNIALYNSNLIFGILLIIIGVVAMFLGNVLSIMLGIYFLVAGSQKVYYGILLKKFNESSWIIVLAVGVLLAVVGIITFFTKGEAAITVTGICLIGYGLINFINVLLLRRRSKYFLA